MPVVGQGMGSELGCHVHSVALQFLVGHRDGSGHRLAGEAALASSLSEAVLDGLHLEREPLDAELAEDAAVVGGIAVVVGVALPGDDGREVGRAEAGDAPGVDGVVGDAAHTDLATAPGLDGGPLDAVVEVLRLARRLAVDEAG